HLYTQRVRSPYERDAACAASPAASHARAMYDRSCHSALNRYDQDVYKDETEVEGSVLDGDNVAR
ncbi:MAG TPA: hypothetical protein VFU72_10765, partial [Nitrolancea sp.]|nr:hypothetical protein [Nitrolancea sp.]